MKGFIELTSIGGNTRLIKVDTITHVCNQRKFSESEYEEYPELKDRKEWTFLMQQCACHAYFVQDTYEEVIKKMEEALSEQ